MSSRSRDLTPALLGIGGVAVCGGLLIAFLATDLFPFHSSNHDEGVYLQHARILLSGRLWMTTPLPETFQHWFFVQDGPRLYSKYQPVVPAMFAIGIALEAPRLVLAAVGTGVVALVGLLTREAFDGRTGVLASALVVATPLYLINTAVFLPYAPTAALNLTFGYCYVRTVRAADRWLRWSSLAGLAVGLAFFARPYTAFLFALPFVGHGITRLAVVRTDPGQFRDTFVRLFPTAMLGVLFVIITLGYNAVVTGDPWVFPYQAFAPADGLGFGERRILGYGRVYSPALALEANSRVFWEFATRWTVAAPLGAIAALGGTALTLKKAVTERLFPPEDPLPEPTLRLLFVGVFLTVGVGNVAFWGNLNILADMSDPSDGLIAQLGPFYHYDLLLPLSALGAAAVVRAGDWVWTVLRRRTDRRTAVTVALAVVLLVTPLTAAAQADALAPPLAENQEYTERFETVYAPMTTDGTLDPPRGIVFVPTPYGPWLGHPFQALRNPGDLRGETVFALDRDADATFAVVDEYPDRQLHRFTFRGEWTAVPRGQVHGAIQPLQIRSGTSPLITFETGAVGRLSTVRLTDGDDAVTYRVAEDRKKTSTIRLRFARRNGTGQVNLVSPGLTPTDGSEVAFRGSDDITLAVTYLQAGGATITYRLELAADVGPDGIRLVWPPELRVCRLTPDCGNEGTYIQGRGEYVSGVRANVTLTGAT